VAFGDSVGLAAAIQRLLTDSDASKTMGERGRHRVHQEYSWERVADRVLSSYQEVLAAAQ
jgi:glycosyltransferase involved in cell wall biosynthesis